MNAKNLIIPLLLVLFCCMLGCRNKQHNKVNENVRDLSQIKDSGELVVLTLYSSTSYFNYRGQEMGFQYELSEQFAKSMGLKLRIEVANSVDELIRKLLAGEGDMIAYNLPITKEWKDSILYCGEDIITHQVIVQQGKSKSLKDVTELVGKDIYVKPGKYYDRLVNLNNELGGGIHIHKVTSDSITVEDSFAAFFAYISGSSFVFQNVYGVSAQAFSLIFGINGVGLMINGAVTGRLTGRIADWKLLRFSLCLAAVGSVALLAAFSTGMPLPVIMVILFLTVSTLSMMSTSSFSMAMQDQGRSAGSASALIGFFSMISGAVMAPVVGIAGDHTAIPMGIVMVIGEIGALLAFYALIYPRHRKEH